MAGACRAAIRIRPTPCADVLLAQLKIIDIKVISEWQGHRDGGKPILDTYSYMISSPAAHGSADDDSGADNVAQYEGSGGSARASSHGAYSELLTTHPSDDVWNVGETRGKKAERTP